jgi:hypothetical protein
MDDRLLRQAKLEATRSGRTLTALIEQAVRELLARERRPRRRPVVPLPTFRGQGLCPGVDLDDGVALRDLMDGANAPR